MREKILEMKEVSFSYDAHIYALKNVSVAIHKQEKIAVLGANGAGKSTFFLNMNGVRKPDGGAIFLDGKKIEKKLRHQLSKRIGIVFQDADSQIIASTVKAEVAFGPLNMGLSREVAEKRAVTAMEQLRLQQFSERPPHYLSGGEKKRVTIADVLAMDCEIIIFDEPASSLDPLHAEMLEDILRDLASEGKTILLSTHDVDFAYRFADRILIFHEGQLIADGGTQEIFQNEQLLTQAHLKKPVILQMFELLRKKNLIGGGTACPKSIQEIEQLL